MANKNNDVKSLKSILKRVDVGLVIGVLAIMVSYLAVMAAKDEVETAQATQKAMTLPVIQIDMGYNYQTEPYTYSIALKNSGPGLAYIQNVYPLVGDKRIEDYKELQKIIMNGRMLSNATFSGHTAGGYLSAGDTVIPWQFKWGKSGRNEIRAYLRGAYGPPMKDLDLEVCYCSIFDDCWITRASDHKKPKVVTSCGSTDTQDDFFDETLKLRAAQKLKK